MRSQLDLALTSRARQNHRLIQDAIEPFLVPLEFRAIRNRRLRCYIEQSKSSVYAAA
jgi:hypothetical protein